MTVLRIIFLGDGCERVSGATFALPARIGTAAMREKGRPETFWFKAQVGFLYSLRWGGLRRLRCRVVGALSAPRVAERGRGSPL